jgi:pimeloyl-ACP methyl ester carboxylesterase
MKRKAILILCGLMLLLTERFCEAEEGKNLTFVFVHGGFGSGYHWRNVAAPLQASGHTVYRPSLTGLGERAHLTSPGVNLSTHIQDIVGLCESERLTEVILVGHSYGGMVITGVAHRIPERLAKLIYIDALLPNDGESSSLFLDHPHLVGLKKKMFASASERGGGWLTYPPWETDPENEPTMPLATKLEGIALGNPLGYEVPGIYILTVDGIPEEDFCYSSSERARERGWPVHILEADHNPQDNMPEKLAELIIAVIK